MDGLVRRTYVVPGWGTGEVWARGSVVVLHVLAGTDPTLPAAGAAPGPATPKGARTPPGFTLPRDATRESDAFVTGLCRRVAAHLAGERTSYDDVELDLTGRTDFDRALAAALRRVPWGEVVTYGELAALAGRPGAARAAGAFCAGNDVALVVPCHRVVAASGIGGYGASGVLIKRRLLALEGVTL